MWRVRCAALSCCRASSGGGRLDCTKAPSEPTGDCAKEEAMKPNNAAPDTVLAAVSAACVAYCLA
jgi:hypothetical protein